MTSAEAGHNVLMLSVRTGSGQQQRYGLCEGATLIVGRGHNCGLRLEDDSVAPMHCVLRLSSGTLTVQDWCSHTGTFVGEMRVTDETEVAAGVAIRAGAYEIVAERPEMPFRDEPASDSQDEDDVEASIEESPVEGNEGDPPAAEPSGDALDADENLQSEPIADERQTCDAVPRTAMNVLQTQTADRTSCRVSALSWDEEANVLLQEEIELLQLELAERDARIQELTAMLETSAEPVPTIEAAEMDSLMSRLEDLLNELSHGDQRIRALEELLRTSQEANQAEQEERQQIEQWLNDIEGRLAERDSEWLAEREVLLGRLEKLREQRDELLQQLDKATAAVPAPEIPRGALKKLQGQIDELQEQLQLAQKQRSRAEESAQALEKQLSQSSRQEQVEAAVREERLRLAQERAALSRERAELARGANDQADGEHGNGLREADARFQAFRETLRELHQKETAPEVRKTGLGSRLAEIWRRLDGPTDTD